MTSDESKRTALEQLVSLINGTTSFEATWVRFHLLLQAGLAAALWAVAAYTPGVPPVPATQPATQSEHLRVFLSLLIPLFGMVFCVAVTIIHVGIQRWSHWYIWKIRDLRLPEMIFPPPREGEAQSPARPDELRISRRARVILAVNVVIILAWAAAACVLMRSTEPLRQWAIPIPLGTALVLFAVVYWRVRQKSHVIRFTFSVGRIVRITFRRRTRKGGLGSCARLAVRLVC